MSQPLVNSHDIFWFISLAVFFVGTGVLQPCLIEILSYNGACAQSTMLFLFPNYVAMSMSILFASSESRKRGRVPWKKVLGLGGIDIVSTLLCFTGMIKAGSAIYTVIYSSVTAYTAIFSYFLLGRNIRKVQWLGVVVIVVGLACSSLGSHKGQDVDNEVSWGVCMILVGSMLHSLTYIMSESILTREENPIAPEMLCALMGAMGSAVYGLWQVVYTIPRFETLIIGEVKSHNGTGNVILASYIALVIVNLIHALCFFNLLSKLGSTSTGVMKGVQSVLVFVISHFAFCSIQASQCFTPFKGISLGIVVLGVFLYSYFHTHNNTHGPLPPGTRDTDDDKYTDGEDVAEVLGEYAWAEYHSQNESGQKQHQQQQGDREDSHLGTFRSSVSNNNNLRSYGSASLSAATAGSRGGGGGGGGRGKPPRHPSFAGQQHPQISAGYKFQKVPTTATTDDAAIPLAPAPAGHDGSDHDDLQAHTPSAAIV